jgi:hypothetical protein
MRPIVPRPAVGRKQDDLSPSTQRKKGGKIGLPWRSLRLCERHNPVGYPDLQFPAGIIRKYSSVLAGLQHILSKRRYLPLPDLRRHLTKARTCRDSRVQPRDCCIPQGRTLSISGGAKRCPLQLLVRLRPHSVRSVPFRSARLRTSFTKSGSSFRACFDILTSWSYSSTSRSVHVISRRRINRNAICR